MFFGRKEVALPFKRSGGLQSFLLGRELLRERLGPPNTDAAEVVEARKKGGGESGQVGMGVNKNVWKHDI